MCLGRGVLLDPRWPANAAGAARTPESHGAPCGPQPKAHTNGLRLCDARQSENTRLDTDSNGPQGGVGGRSKRRPMRCINCGRESHMSLCVILSTRSQAQDPKVIQSNFSLRGLYTRPKDNASYAGICNRSDDSQRHVYGVSEATLANGLTVPCNLFAGPHAFRRIPYWPNAVVRHVQPAANRAGISKRIGWHTFRHTLATLLQASGAGVKVTKN